MTQGTLDRIPRRRLVTVEFREDVAETVLQILSHARNPNARRAEVRLAEALRKTQAPRADRRSGHANPPLS